ncbi:protoporphyrinogen oxidase HemJ [Methylobacterium brachythecii]|uniref:Protoporphyrinogen IX oxidase n=1 Tax=Methylobacterium brachythecii TaxID=1176177 RepID=A0A7W6AGK3_9HYPH|nr:protoporphyrinogen oxidase HemJ [Methylobacterium brachythecii]MBB3900646.1 putative membrane protein [Methylobacterium brachythecii]GLS43523.1 membrane protein [Methylobacterium brachythecii]
MDNLYLWIKAGHVVSLIAWMAAMLYLPRLFVYHAGLPAGSEVQSATFKIMERRLLKAIMTPAMILTWIFGIILAVKSGYYTSYWLQMKFLLVLVMSGIHGWLSKMVKDFAADRNRRGDRFYRVVNEVPTLLMILIVILAVVKPGG